MKRSRPSRSYVPVLKLCIKAAKKQHDNRETHEYNVVEDTSECDDVTDETSESSSKRQNEVCMNAELSRISLNRYEN